MFEVIEAAALAVNLYKPDNACGTAIVTEEIMQRHMHQAGTAANIHVVDAAPNMVDIAPAQTSGTQQGGRFTITSHVTPGKHLSSFQDDTFTHNITNLGILFFKHGAAGAKEI